MRKGWKKLSLKQFYKGGGFANPQFCRYDVGGVWTYWQYD